MLLQKGRFYLTRDGHRAEVLKTGIGSREYYKVVGLVDDGDGEFFTCEWGDDGRYYVSQSDRDLITQVRSRDLKCKIVIDSSFAGTRLFTRPANEDFWDTGYKVIDVYVEKNTEINEPFVVRGNATKIEVNETYAVTVNLLGYKQAKILYEGMEEPYTYLGVMTVTMEPLTCRWDRHGKAETAGGPALVLPYTSPEQTLWFLFYESGEVVFRDNREEAEEVALNVLRSSGEVVEILEVHLEAGWDKRVAR